MPVVADIDQDAASTQASLTQSLDRAIGLLEDVVNQAARGAALGALAEQSQLSKPTAHRLLSGLRKLGLVDYDEKSRLFFPGLKLYRMGLAAAPRFDLVQLAQPGMALLAEETGDTVYLSLRAGDSALCVARQTGSFPIRTLTLEVGDYRPLGLGAGSLALLSALPDEEVEQVIARNREKLAPHANFDQVSLRAMVRQTREQGHSLNDGKMLPEMAAIGVIVHDASGRPAAALSIATIASRMQPERRASIVALLMREARALEQALGVTTPSGARE
ncbi:IclR family transcriptional regulator [Hydrogenophaga sp.]|uniref:IclR family transcriptional regulator n=1 Tax=Hydrogenophaga sp. TaxID=1904254 RepID=UPI0026058E47|nr:IclR family transcriptional regulator [Hydrogenophaga sp.]MCW5654556.1 IclR family transcriptional regulator [Hydrogenophaga sp.]